MDSTDALSRYIYNIIVYRYIDVTAVSSGNLDITRVYARTHYVIQNYLQ